MGHTALQSDGKKHFGVSSHRSVKLVEGTLGREASLTTRYLLVCDHPYILSMVDDEGVRPTNKRRN